MYSRIPEIVPVREINGFFNAHGYQSFDPSQTEAAEIATYLKQVVDQHGEQAATELQRLVDRHSPAVPFLEKAMNDGTGAKHNCDGGGCGCGGAKKLNADGDPVAPTGVKGFVHKHGELIILGSVAIAIALIVTHKK